MNISKKKKSIFIPIIFLTRMNQAQYYFFPTKLKKLMTLEKKNLDSSSCQYIYIYILNFSYEYSKYDM